MPDGTVLDCTFCARSGVTIADWGELFLRLDDAPLATGHLLFCPSRHTPSFADLSDDEAASAEQLLAAVVAEVEDAFGGPVLVLEHGRTGHCAPRDPGERFCHHAHLHVLPGLGAMAPDVQRLVGGQHIPLGEMKIGGLPAATGTDDGYFYVADANGGIAYRSIGVVPSHLLRTHVARLLGDESLAEWYAHLGTARSTALMVEAEGALASMTRCEDVR